MLSNRKALTLLRKQLIAKMVIFKKKKGLNVKYIQLWLLVVVKTWNRPMETLH